ncbi:MAG: HAD-IB family hydrolase [Methylophilaceae bacterium]|nr:HAD-IB family hydrolase [Methylophilaceae bacterium]
MKNIALFDLDNTLLAGDSDYNWNLFLIKQGVLDEQSYQARNEGYFADYQQGCLDIKGFLHFQFETLCRHPRQLLEHWRAEYVQTVIKPMLAPQAQALVAEHRAAGDTLVVITATNSFVTRPIASLFGIDNLIASDPEEIDGQFTGEIAGVPSFQEGKVVRLRAWLGAQGLALTDFERSYFYSDSHNDLSLLQQVTHPVAVDADAQLTQYAQAQGWRCLSLRGLKTLQNLANGMRCKTSATQEATYQPDRRASK